jgi:hypothetical protein
MIPFYPNPSHQTASEDAPKLWFLQYFGGNWSPRALNFIAIRNAVVFYLSSLSDTRDKSRIEAISF